MNKVKNLDDDQQEGPVLPSLPELELSMTDEELVSLKNKWEKNWLRMAGELGKIQEENEAYWLGKQWDATSGDSRPIMDNLIFESIETLLPIASRQNPEPIVSESGGNDPKGPDSLAHKVQKMLMYLADTKALKLKNKKLLRFWMLYRLGASKIAWSEVENDISYHILRPQKLILDPDATISELGIYTGEYIGERKKDTASKLALRFPKKKAFIEQSVNKLMGTEVNYIEWWTDEYCFFTLEKEVLGKYKNPHWNYAEKKMVFDPMGGQVEEEQEGKNHFTSPQKPYIFFSVFNLGKHPFDDTSLIEQNLSNQDSINKRKKQIDKNADQTNGGIAVNSDYFSKEEATAASRAVREGGVILTPGNPNDVITRLQAPPLPNFVYQDLQDSRAVTLGNFGIRGSTPQGTKSEDTVRGKILTKAQDESRISGITEYLEQYMDRVYNWMTQMMYVYYDEIHSVAVIGQDGKNERVTLSKTEFENKLLVSVKEGSAIPKDDLTRANQAIDLWSAGAIDPITLYDRLQFPNPVEMAKRLVQFKTDPISIFPDLMAQRMQMQQAQMAQPQGSMAEQAAAGGDVRNQQNTPSSTSPQPPADVLNQIPIQ